MKPRLSAPLRFGALPALAAATVVLIAGLTLVDLSRSLFVDSTRAPPPAGPLAPVPADGCRATDVSREVPDYTEEEALEALGDYPTRGAVARLWPLSRHRERLYELLLARKTSEEIRIHLLGAFETADAERALEGAREIVDEEGLSEGPLLAQAMEVVSRLGGEGDLELLVDRPHESHQLRSLREKYREAIRRRFR